MAASFAALLRQWRGRALLSQEQLAQRAGLGVRTVRRLETEGIRRPHGDSVRALADALGLSEAARAELIAAAGHGGASASNVPRQLPPPVPRLIGRQDELKRLTELAGDATTSGSTIVIAAIGGTAGIGKTTLALHWSHQVADRFPDGQLYVNLRGFDPGGQVMDPGTAIRNFLEALGVSPQHVPADLDGRSALYRTAISGRRMLVVLDNARDSSQVRPLLPGAGGCLVLVTSRHQLTGLASHGAHLLNLDLLSTSEAREFVAHRLGAGRAAADPQAVDHIIARCARLPLALAVVAARAAANTQPCLGALAAQLGQARERLDVLAGDDPATDVRAVFSWSYQALSPSAARLFRLLGLHPGPEVGVSAAASVAGVTVVRMRPLLDELVRASLLAEQVAGRYTCHDLLRAYAMELAHLVDGDAAVRDGRHRMLDYYLHAAFAADGRLPLKRERVIEPEPARPDVVAEVFADTEEAMAWFAGELPVLLAAVPLAASTGFDTHAGKLAWYLAPFLRRRGYWPELVAIARCAVESARRLDDPAAQAHAHRGLGSAYIRLGRYEEADAELQRALDFYREAGDLLGQARTHHNRATIFDQADQAQRLIDECVNALALYRAAGHREGEATAQGDMGWGYIRLGDYQQAVVACRQALALLQEIGSRPGEAAAWDSLGHAHHHLGNHRQAIECYRNALAIGLEGGGDLYDLSAMRERLGDAYHAAGDGDAARREWRAALNILNGLGHSDAGRLRAKLGRPRLAVRVEEPP